MTDQRSGIIIRGYVGGILGEDIAYNLIHRIISLFRECIIYKHQRFLHLNLFSSLTENVIVLSYMKILPPSELEYSLIIPENHAMYKGFPLFLPFCNFMHPFFCAV